MSVFDEAVEHLKTAQEKYQPVKTYVMFSGGNDSTILLHAMWATGLCDAAVHINTGIGIEETRKFVRSFCNDYSIPLIEKFPPDRTYEDLVMQYGFPGPSMHRTMFQQLKERAVRELVREAKTKRMDRVLLVTGQRRDESARRKMNVVDVETRYGAQVWLSPLMDATKPDLWAYRREHNVPENEVSALLHMSGECLCGAYAKPDELQDISTFYPETGAYLRDLERRVEAAGQKRCKWGAGAREKARKGAVAGPLCTDCEVRVESTDTSLI